MFFLLSGLVIASTLVRRSSTDNKYGFGRYTADRIGRIHSGLIPALLFVAAVDITLVVAGVYEMPYNLSPGAFVANIFMLQSYRGAWQEVLQWPSFGSASPWWTLSVEFHIYLFIGALFFVFKGSRWWPILLVVALFYSQYPLLYLAGPTPLEIGEGLLSLWLAGFALAFVLSYSRISPVVGAGIALAAALYFVRNVSLGKEYSFQLYPALTLCFAATVAATLSTRRTHNTAFSKVVRFFADYSFTLYLIHYTVLYALTKVVNASGIHRPIVCAIFGIIISNALAVALAYVTERHHKKVADAIYSTFGRLLSRSKNHRLPDTL